MLGVFGRYVARETAIAWAGVAGVLILVVVVNRFAVYLGQAAAGAIPTGGTFVLLGLSVVGLLEIVIPVSLFLAAILTLGRSYRDGEATVAWTCGLTPVRLYRPFLFLATIAALMLAALAFYLSPWAKARSHQLERQAHAVAQISVLTPGRFKLLSGGKGVFYAGGLAPDGKTLSHVFAEIDEGENPVVLTSAHGQLRFKPATGERHLVLAKGERYAGKPGRLDWTRTHFASADLLIRPPQTQPAAGGDLSRLPTSALLARDDAGARAAFEWRIAQPLTVLVLLLIAVPLAHSRPRSGRYARLVPAILIYIVYFNLLGVARVWAGKGHLALWWVPALAAAVGFVLLWRQYGRRRGKSRRGADAG